MWINFLAFLLLLFSFISICTCHGGGLERRTMMVSLDGFRWDYVDRIRMLKGENNSNIWRLIKNGAFASKGVENTFVTVTFPNHYTLVTGLYEENHGIVSGVVYDPDLGRTEVLANGKSKWPFGGEPIWTTVLKEIGMRESAVGCVMWVACQFGDFKNYVPYNDSMTWEERIDRAVHWIVHDSSQLVLLYYHEPDRTGHTHGPDSKEMNETLVAVDDMVGQLIQKLEENDLLHEINLLIVSDHGMTTRLDADNPILNGTTLPEDMFHVRSKESALWLVEPMPGRYDDTVKYFKSFPHLTVMEKDLIPDRLHYKHNRRITPLLVLADHGYSLHSKRKGDHGYDNSLEDMRPTLIAHGPAFMDNSTIPPEMSTVDVYLLLCAILDLTPAANNGTVQHLRSFVRSPYLRAAESILNRYPAVTWIVSLSVIMFALVMYIWHRRRVTVHKKKFTNGEFGGSNGYLYRPLALQSAGPLLTTASAELDFEDSDEYEEYNALGKQRP